MFQGHELDISIHSLRMEGDLLYLCMSLQFLQFQSTPSAWRETVVGVPAGGAYAISIHSLRMEGDQNAAFSLNIQSYFNPLPPHGGRPGFSVAHRPHGEISIHSLRMEGDGIIANKKEYQGISIHSLRMEGDLVQRELYTDNHHFNPLPPHGGRLPCREIPSGTTHFNPLPPHGGRQQNCTGKRFSFRLSLYNPAKKDAKDYILHPKKWFFSKKGRKI